MMMAAADAGVVCACQCEPAAHADLVDSLLSPAPSLYTPTILDVVGRPAGILLLLRSSHPILCSSHCISVYISQAIMRAYRSRCCTPTSNNRASTANHCALIGARSSYPPSSAMLDVHFDATIDYILNRLGFYHRLPLTLHSSAPRLFTLILSTLYITANDCVV